MVMPNAGREDVTNPAVEESSFHIKLVPAMDQSLLHRYSCIFPTWLWLDPWPQAYLWTHRDMEAAFWCQLCSCWGTLQHSLSREHDMRCVVAWGSIKRDAHYVFQTDMCEEGDVWSEAAAVIMHTVEVQPEPERDDLSFTSEASQSECN